MANRARMGKVFSSCFVFLLRRNRSKDPPVILRRKSHHESRRWWKQDADDGDHSKNVEYDFGIICSKDDLLEVREVCEKLMKDFNLKGCVPEDLLPCGAEIFDVYENSMEMCSKVIFYITENLTGDDFCSHLCRNAVIDEEHIKKIIPIVKTSDTPVPETLELVRKLSLDKKEQFEDEFREIFRPVKERRLQQQEEQETNSRM